MDRGNVPQIGSVNLNSARTRLVNRPGLHALRALVILVGVFTLAGCVQEFDRQLGPGGAGGSKAGVDQGQNPPDSKQPTLPVQPTSPAVATATLEPTVTPVPSTATTEPTAEPTAAPTPTAEPTPTPEPAPAPTPVPTPTRPSSLIPGLSLRILGPPEGTRATNNAVVVHGITTPGASVQVNGAAATVEGDGRFRAEVSLFPGFNFLSVVAADRAGNRQNEVITVVLPPQSFVLEVTEPRGQSVVSQRHVKVAGLTGSEATAHVNGRQVAVDQLGAFSTKVTLDLGPNVIEIIANNRDGQELTTVIAVIYRP